MPQLHAYPPSETITRLAIDALRAKPKKTPSRIAVPGGVFYF